MGRSPNLKERVNLGAFIFIAFLILLPLEAISNGDEITIGFPPYQSRTETFRRFQPILEQLKSKSVKNIKTIFYKNTKSLLKDLEEGRIDMAYLDIITYTKSPFSRPVVLFNYKGGERLILIAKKDSNILKVEDLRNHILAIIEDGGERIWLRSLIRDKSEIFFKEIKVYPGFDSVIFGVLFGETEAGVTTKGILEDLKKRYPAIKRDIKIIAISSPYPGYLLVAYKGMDEDILKLFRDKLLDLSRTIDGALSLSSIGIESIKGFE